MLRQLLSTAAPGDDLMTGPTASASGASEVVKYEPDSQDFAVLSTVPPPPNFQYAPVTNGYSVEQPIYASGQFYQAEPPAPEVPYFNGSTSELFSSTYAVLSSDPLVSASGNWSPYGIDEKPTVLAQPVYLTSYAPPVPHLTNNGGYITYDHAAPYAVPLGTERNGHAADYAGNPPPGNVLVPISVETGAPQPIPNYDARRSDSSTPHNGADCSGSVDLQRNTISRSSIGSDTDRKKPKMSVRASQAAFSEAFKKVAAGGSVTGSDDNSPAESEDGEGGERVQCLACKGVYASRRSLTGHIGRNERCREIIGRNYLDQLVQAGQEECIPDSITTGVSPVCPYCDRFISHYKGNIRRHMNQCNKARAAKGANVGAEQNGAAPMEQFSEDGSIQHAYLTQPVTYDQPTSSTSYASSISNGHHAPTPHMWQPQGATSSMLIGANGIPMPPGSVVYCYDNNGANYISRPHPSASSMEMDFESHAYTGGYASAESAPLPANTSEPPPTKGKGKGGGRVKAGGNSANPSNHASACPPEDPYLCSWCTFNTIYKGNMKRHLISCHAMTDDIIRSYGFDLERLRRTHSNRATPDCLPITPKTPGAPKDPSRKKSATGDSHPHRGRPKKQRPEPPVPVPILPSTENGTVSAHRHEAPIDTHPGERTPQTEVNEAVQSIQLSDSYHSFGKDCSNDSGISLACD